jgi:hypothetical protein
MARRAVALLALAAALLPLLLSNAAAATAQPGRAHAAPFQRGPPKDCARYDWFEQRLDHFGGFKDDATWRQRYLL